MSDELIVTLFILVVYVIAVAGALVWLFSRVDRRVSDLEDRVEILEALFRPPAKD